MRSLPSILACFTPGKKGEKNRIRDTDALTKFLATPGAEVSIPARSVNHSGISNATFRRLAREHGVDAPDSLKPRPYSEEEFDTQMQRVLDFYSTPRSARRRNARRVIREDTSEMSDEGQNDGTQTARSRIPRVNKSSLRSVRVKASATLTSDLLPPPRYCPIPPVV